MGAVMLYLTLIDGRKDLGAPGALFERRMSTAFCPVQGSMIVLFPYPNEGPDDGPARPVRKVWWGADGTVLVEIEKIVVDPIEARHDLVRASLGTAWQESSWFTASNGDLAEQLLAGGWERSGDG